MKRFLITLTLTLGLVAARANAVMLDPIAPIDTTGMAGSIDVDITISGLSGEIVSGFDFDMLYTDSILTPTSVAFGGFLGDVSLGEAAYLVELGLGLPPVTPGLLALSGFSFLSDADLAALQPDSFVLATVSFDIVGEGVAEFDYDLDVGLGLDVKGLNNEIILPEPVVRVSEPGSALLLAFGLGVVLLAANRRRRGLLAVR